MAHGSHTKAALKRIETMVDDALDLSWLNIKTVPPISPTLKSLDCSYSNIEALPDLPPTLVSLKCSFTKIRRLPPLPKTLTSLECINCRNLEIVRSENETIEDYEKRWALVR
jgi:Leucine-rich repeat (LRR) protein